MVILTYWWQRKDLATRYLLLMMLCSAFWAFGAAMEQSAAHPAQIIFWVKFQYLGVLFCPVMFLFFALEYNHLSRLLTWKNQVLVVIIPVITFILTMTNEWHFLIWRGFVPTTNGIQIMTSDYGTIFWLGAFLYPYSLVLIAAFLVVRGSVYLSKRKSTAILMVGSVIATLLVNTISIFGWSPLYELKLTSIFLIIMGAVLNLALVDELNQKIIDRTNSLEVFELLFHNTPDILCIIRLLDGHFVDVNQSYLQATGYTRDEVIGHSTVDLNIWENPAERLHFEEILGKEGFFQNQEIAFCRKDGSVLVGMVYARVLSLRNEPHIFCVIHDVTARKQSQELALKLSTLEERQRLARDLHDSVNQSIHGLVLLSETLSFTLEKGNLIRAAQISQRIQDYSRQALRETRLMLFQLRPSPMEIRQDFIRALEERLKSVEGRVGINTTIEEHGFTEYCPPEWYKDLFFIISEALNNALKHAQATNIKILLWGTPTNLEVEVHDDGIGFDSLKPPVGGFGLQTMRERAGLLGGQVEAGSEPGFGSVVRFYAQRLVTEKHNAEN